jgi:hypothetical protein
MNKAMEIEAHSADVEVGVEPPVDCQACDVIYHQAKSCEYVLRTQVFDLVHICGIKHLAVTRMRTHL